MNSLNSSSSVLVLLLYDLGQSWVALLEGFEMTQTY